MNTSRIRGRTSMAGASLLIGVFSTCLVIAQEDTAKKLEELEVASETRWPVDAHGWTSAESEVRPFSRAHHRRSATVVSLRQDLDGSCRVTFRVQPAGGSDVFSSVALIGPSRLSNVLGKGLEVELRFDETSNIVGVAFDVKLIPNRCTKEGQNYKFVVKDSQNQRVLFSLVVPGAQLSNQRFSELVSRVADISVDLSPVGAGAVFPYESPDPNIMPMLVSTVTPAVIWEVSQPASEGFGRRRVPETWTSHAGETMSATFIRLDSGRQLVTFRLPNGRNIDVPMRNLAPSSRARAQVLSETSK